MGAASLLQHKTYAFPNPKMSSENDQSIENAVKGPEIPTISLSVYDAIHSIRVGAAAGIPCVLPTCETAPVE